LAIVLSALLLFAVSDCSFGILRPLCCLFFFYLLFLIAPLGRKIPKEQSETANRRRTDNTMATKYQRSNQKQQIEEEQTTQWPQDTKGAIRNSK
jgi:flagellar biosynthesis component FlhA